MDLQSMTFEDFGFRSEVLKGVIEAGFTIPSPIQQKAIPIVLSGKDVIAQAHTGTGKTAAFGLPILNMIDSTNRKVEALVITPTRELATQVSDELYKLGQYNGIRTMSIYGGQSYSRQLNLLDKGVNIVVATPGRLLDILKSGKMPNFNPKFVVLDEADEMLDMGFLDDIKEIFTFLPKDRQTLLFSATMPTPIKTLAQTILNNPEFITVSTGQTTNKDIKQYYYVIEESERDDALSRLLDSFDKQKSIIFCRMKVEVDRVSAMLIGRGYSANCLHGDMEQKQRERIIKSFKNNELDILVATDVAARGIDISNVSHVFNYHIPFDPESYVHRIGRTGRGGNSGSAITFVTPLEFRELERIKKKIGDEMELCFIPSAQEVKSVNLQKKLQDIRSQEIKNEAIEMLNILKEEMDLTHVCLKLISQMLEDEKIDGPEKIGIDIKRLNALLTKHKDSNNRRGQNNRGGGFNRNRSNDRRRDGGSSSGNRDRDRDSNRDYSNKSRSNDRDRRR